MRKFRDAEKNPKDDVEDELEEIWLEVQELAQEFLTWARSNSTL